MYFDTKNYLKSNNNHTFKIDNIPEGFGFGHEKIAANKKHYAIIKFPNSSPQIHISTGFHTN
jgi:hypothetical protein